MDAAQEIFESFEDEEIGHISGAHLRHILQEAQTTHNTQLLPAEVRRPRRCHDIHMRQGVNFHDRCTG